jgi:hypothetical protein
MKERLRNDAMLLFQSKNNPVLINQKDAGKEEPRANGILRMSALVCALVLLNAWCAMARTNVVTVFLRDQASEIRPADWTLAGRPTERPPAQ